MIWRMQMVPHIVKRNALDSIWRMQKSPNIVKRNNLNMIWDNCLNVDLSQIDFDLVLTSPPYINLEKYENMALFKSDDEYYNDFLIVMLNRCLQHIKNNGWVCINISMVMYDKLINKYGYRECDEKHILPNAKDNQNLKKCEYIYCWKS